ncbi:MAG: BrnT family toxin [Pyrinomonadaceae bacterium]
MHTCAYTAGVPYEWNPKKAAGNLRKHGIDFADAATIFEDDNPEKRRWITIGVDALARILVVVYTWREANICIISARYATASERGEYEKGL